MPNTSGLHPITAYRQKHGLTKAALAAKMGCTYVSLIRWERGEPISLEWLPKIMEATGIPGPLLRPDIAAMMGVKPRNAAADRHRQRLRS